MPINLEIGLGIGRAGGTVTVMTGPDTSVSTAWAGDVTQTTFTAAHTTAADTQGTRLVVSTDPTFATGKIYSAYRDTTTKTVQHTVSGLTADTAYYFCIEVNGTLKTTKSGSFKTMAASNSFRFAFGGCQSGYNNGKVLGQLQALATVPRFFVHLGDLHYDDIGTNPPVNGTSYVPEFDASISSVLGGTYSGPFLRQMPTYSIHDDHDFGPNDSGIYYPDPNNGNARTLNPSRSDSLSVFRRRRPNPALGINSTPATDPVCFSFVQGRIRFVVTDMRSQRDDTSTVLGTAQKAWFKGQIDAAYAAGQNVCWVHSTPFISNGWTDGWDGPAGTFGREAERQELGTYIVNAGMGGRIFCLTGDYHMMAGDSGASSDYSDYGGLRMPVFHACGLSATLVASNIPMDLGYSLPKSSVAGYIDVTDDGTTMTLAFTGIGMDAADSAATTLLTHTTSLPRPVPTKPTAITLVQETYRRLGLTGGVGAGPTVYTVNPYRSTPISGNLLLLAINLKATNTGTLAAPTGWTRLGTDQKGDNTFHQAFFYRWADGTEGSSISFTLSGPRINAVAVMEFSGVHPTTPFGQDVVDAASATTRTTAAPTFTPTNDNEVALVFVETQDFGHISSGITWASGYVQRFFNPAGSIGGALGFFVASKQLSTAGVAETATASWSGTAEKTQARAITILPIPPAPSNSVAPAVSGTTTTGSVVTSSTGTWSNSPTSYTYQWKRNGSNIVAATSSTYTLQVADEGTSVICVVTATNPGGSASANSNTITPTAPPASSHFDSTTITFDNTSHKMDEN